MSTPSSVKRAPDPTGDAIKTYQDAGGNQIQAVGLADGAGGQAGLQDNPLYTRDEFLAELIGAINRLRDHFGYPDNAGRVRVTTEGGTLSTITTVSTVTTTTTVGTLNNIAAIGGVAPNTMAPSINNQNWLALRGQIVVTKP